MSERSFLGFLAPVSLPPMEPVHVRESNPLSSTAVVKAFLEAHPGYHSAREIGQVTGIALPTVNSAVTNLIRYAHVEREHPSQRGRRKTIQRFQMIRLTANREHA
jgi:hypothetical protein